MRALIAAILIIVVGGAMAVGAYDAGLAQGAAQIAAPAGAVVPAVAYYSPHWGYGFFPFGFLFPIFGLFLFLGLLRAVVGGGRGYGHRGWYADGDRGVPGRVEDWHRRAHGEGGAGPTPPHQ